MAQILLYRPIFPARLPATPRTKGVSPKDPSAAARGILLALALSCVVWVALAIGVPMLW